MRETMHIYVRLMIGISFSDEKVQGENKLFWTIMISHKFVPHVNDHCDAKSPSLHLMPN